MMPILKRWIEIYLDMSKVLVLPPIFVSRPSFMMTAAFLATIRDFFRKKKKNGFRQVLGYWQYSQNLGREKCKWSCVGMRILIVPTISMNIKMDIGLRTSKVIGSAPNIQEDKNENVVRYERIGRVSNTHEWKNNK